MNDRMSEVKRLIERREAASQAVPEGYLILGEALEELRSRPDCPDEEELAGLADGWLWRKAYQRARDLKGHVDACPVCRHDVREIAAGLPIQARLRGWRWQVAAASRAAWTSATAAVRAAWTHPGLRFTRPLSLQVGSAIAALGVVLVVPLSYQIGRTQGFKAGQLATKGAVEVPTRPGQGGLSADATLRFLLDPPRGDARQIAKSVALLENYLGEARPEADMGLQLKLLQLYEMQLQTTRDPSARQELGKRIAAQKERLRPLLDTALGGSPHD
jgi:hypothetical protein